MHILRLPRFRHDDGRKTIEQRASGTRRWPMYGPRIMENVFYMSKTVVPCIRFVMKSSLVLF